MLPTRLTLLVLACAALACGESTAVLQKPPPKTPPPATQPAPQSPAPAPDPTPAPTPTPAPEPDAGSSSCGAQCPLPPAPDAAPSVTFLSPAPNALVSGAVVLLRGEVSDDRAGAAVELSTDGVAWLAATVSDGGFELQLPLPSLDAAPLTVHARARDSAGQLAQASRAVQVDNVAPKLTITSPVQGQKFNASHFAGSDAVRVDFTVSDGDPQTIVRQVGTTAALTALEVQTSATDDGGGYTVQLEAVDSAGNVSTDAVDFSVDRVAPRITQAFPLDGSISAARSAVVKFTEPMQASSPALTVSPAVPPGAWGVDRQAFFIELPTPDTLYTLTLGALADDHGNPLGATPTWRVTTTPELPLNGAIIANLVHRFDAATDEDGVLTVVTAAGSYARTHRFDPRTGTFVSDPEVLVLPGEPVQAVAHRTRPADQSPRRVAGARVTSASSNPRVDWWLDRALMTTPNLAAALIPTPALEAEGAGLGPVGFIRNGLYERSGRQSLAVAVRPDRVGAVDGRWELVQLNATGFTRQTFFCSRPYPNAPPSCGLTASASYGQFSSTPRYSHAVTRHCSLHVYDDASGSRVLFTEPFVESCRLGSCPSNTLAPENIFFGLEVATATPTTAVGARRNSQGVAVFDLTPDASCNLLQGASAQLVASNVASFRPVRIGGKPGLVWLDTAGAVRLFLP